MAAAKRKNSSVATYRAKGTIALAPGELGFSSLVDPDTYDPDKPTLKLNLHLSPEAIEQTKEIIRDRVYSEKALAKFIEDAAEEGLKIKAEPFSAEEWLEAKLKEARPSDKCKYPFLVVSNRATYKKRNQETGELEEISRKLAAWDGRNTKLNLPRLRLGRGSIIQPIVHPNLYASKLEGLVAKPSLKLVGVKVLKLVAWGNRDEEVETDEEAIKEVLGEEFAFQDLAAYALGAGHDDEDPEPDLPEDEADRLFGSKE